jgi:hypothetical protein
MGIQDMNGYPVILNGDHAEFETEWVGKDPKDRPDWPLPSFDAMDWANAFCKIADTYGIKDAKGERIDEGWMVSWFASALMRGYDQRSSEVNNLNLDVRCESGCNLSKINKILRK